jgi:competence protein ComEA
MIHASFHALLLGLLALPLTAAPGGGKAKPKGPIHAVNLNAATVTELMQLPKVGAKTAERIISWRKQHGGFRRPEEVMHVKGIGEKGYQRIKPFLRVAQAAPAAAPAAIPAKSGAKR